MIDNGEYPNTEQGRKQAAGHCYSLYDRNKEANGMSLDNIPFLASKIIEGKDEDIVELTAAVGDIFYQETFVSKEVLKQLAPLWNSTVHDISHMGTHYPNGVMGFRENLDYIIGYNDDSHWDEKTNSVKMKAHISHNAPKYNVWKNYMDICRKTGKIPNVSMDVTPAKFGAMKVKDLPAGVIAPTRYVRSGKVRALTGGVPYAVATVLTGKCDDAAGCGISATGEDDCSSGKCNLENEKEVIPLTKTAKFTKMVKKELIRNE